MIELVRFSAPVRVPGIEDRVGSSCGPYVVEGDEDLGSASEARLPATL